MSYPMPVFHFLVDWGGARIGFSEVSGLYTEVEVIEYREGNSPVFEPRKMPGLRKHGNIVLKRGIVPGDNEFFEWLNRAGAGTIERRDLTISLLNDEHQPVVRWKVHNAWPVKLAAPDLKASANEVAIESLEIAHEGLDVEHL